GKFYPQMFPQREMLGYYAQRFATVEINSTFRRMPDAALLKSWTRQVPAGFRFALKAPATITHFRRLKGVQRATTALFRAATKLAKHRGPVFFQLPGNFQKDLPLLDSFLQRVHGSSRIAFEFRNPGWFDDDVLDCLRRHACALCIADARELPRTPVVRTANWGYVRLRRERYTRHQLREWIRKLRDLGWEEVYVYFKHEATGSGPRLAARFLELAGQ